MATDPRTRQYARPTTIKLVTLNAHGEEATAIVQHYASADACTAALTRAASALLDAPKSANRIKGAVYRRGAPRPGAITPPGGEAPDGPH